MSVYGPFSNIQSHLLSSMPSLWSCGSYVRILILTNCCGITNLLLRKFTFIENQTFYEIFIRTTKIWSHMLASLAFALCFFAYKICRRIPTAEQDCLVYYLTCTHISEALKFKPTIKMFISLTLLFILRSLCIVATHYLEFQADQLS